MTIGALLERTEGCVWFRFLGQRVSPAYLSLTDPDDWTALISAEVAADFGLPAKTTAPEWLAGVDFLDPSAPPAHANVDAPALADEIRLAQRQLYKSVLAATRDLAPSPWLVVGPTDLRPAAIRAAGHTARHAAYELLAGVPGPWSERYDIFLAGHWPFGVTADHRLAVL